ncbi:MAG: tetratricopeptide repeat protein [Planctomycetota bacterium]
MAAKPRKRDNQKTSNDANSLRALTERGALLHRRGDLAEAEALYRQALAHAPQHPDVLNLVGLLCAQRSDRVSALEFFERALRATPDHIDALINSGNVLRELGRLDAAERAFLRVVKLAPQHAVAWNNLGVTLKAADKLAEAEEALRCAVTLAPDYGEAHYNYANALRRLARHDEALIACERALELRADDAECHFTLGLIRRARDELPAAVAAYSRAIALKPEHAAAHYYLASALRLLGELDAAIAAYRRALELRPGYLDVYEGFGIACYKAGRLSDACDVYREWSQYEPTHPVPRHMLAAISGEAVPTRADDEYVARVFDAFAESFEADLERLDYRAPLLVAEAITAECGAAAAQFDIIDAGCGTGWCGPYLRPYARRLLGIDLSAGMVAKARAREVYDELVVAELCTYLADARGWDVIASADTLNYFGELAPVFAAAAVALRPAGLFVFTLEARVPSGAPDLRAYALEPHGRYSHERSSVLESLGRAGFELRSARDVALRMEGGKPVNGYLLVARRRAHERVSAAIGGAN